MIAITRGCELAQRLRLLRRLVRMLHLFSGSFLALPPNLGTKESMIGIYRHSKAHDASEEISEEVRFPLGNKILVSF